MKNIFLLDLDDTLLDFARAEQANLTARFAEFGVPATSAAIERFHAINDGLWKALERGEISRERLKERRFELLFEEYGIAKDVPAVARAYFEHFTDYCFPFAGAADFLAALRARGRTYIVTNGSTVIQNRHIADAGFLPYLDGVFISEEMGANKPSKEYAALVRERIVGFRRENALWIGDSLTSDGQCAREMGVSFVLFAPKGTPEGYGGAVARDYGEALSFADGKNLRLNTTEG